MEESALTKGVAGLFCPISIPFQIWGINLCSSPSHRKIMPTSNPEISRMISKASFRITFKFKLWLTAWEMAFKAKSFLCSLRKVFSSCSSFSINRLKDWVSSPISSLVLTSNLGLNSRLSMSSFITLLRLCREDKKILSKILTRIPAKRMPTMRTKKALNNIPFLALWINSNSKPRTPPKSPNFSPSKSVKRCQRVAHWESNTLMTQQLSLVVVLKILAKSEIRKGTIESEEIKAFFSVKRKVLNPVCSSKAFKKNSSKYSPKKIKSGW